MSHESPCWTTNQLKSLGVWNLVGLTRQQGVVEEDQDLLREEPQEMKNQFPNEMKSVQ